MSQITITVPFVIGFLAGILACAVFALIQNQWHKRTLKNRFGKLDGTYKGYAFKPDDKWVLQDKPKSKAEIKYERDNILSITLTHNEELTWQGLINMETEKYGAVSWQYTNLTGSQLRFGFKRCIVSPEGDKVYLVGEESEGYQKEILIRDETK